MYPGYGRRMGRGMGGGFAAANLPMIPKTAPNAYRAVATLDGNAGLSSPISYRFARAPFISVIDYLDGKILDLKIIPNSLASGGGGVGIALAQWILSIGANAVLGSRFGPNLMMVLRQGNINPLIVSPGIPLGEAVKALGVNA